MKILTPLVALALFASAQVSAQTAASSTAFKALPPPTINDPGVDVSKEPAAAKADPNASTPAEVEPTRMPGKPIPLPRMPGDTGPSQAMPDVEVKQQGDNTVQEFRQDGRVYMVVVTPKRGPTQTYMVDGRGKLEDSQGRPPVGPVMYNVLEWGKPMPPASGDDSNN